MRESRIESELRKRIEEIGGKAFKFSSPGNNGVPDRIILYNGGCYFVELKRPGQELKPLQRVMRKKFYTLGFKIYVIDTFDKVGDFIDGIQTTQLSGNGN